MKTVLLILGAPLWIPLLIAGFAIILSIYIALWALIISLFAVFISLVACAIGTVAAGIYFVIIGNNLTGVAIIGVGIICLGLSAFMHIICKLSAKYTLSFTKRIAFVIKNSF